MELMIFNNGELVGRVRRHEIGKPTLFGLDINAISHPGRYAIVCMVLLALVSLMVASMRRGRSGRRLLAVRTNERAAAALGISVPGAKIYAFAVSAGIAAIGGVLLAFRKDVILYGSEFTNFTSILVVAWSFIGGIGYLLGPLFGATLAPGSLGAQLTNTILDSVTQYIQLIGGVIVVLLVLQNQDGIAKESTNQFLWLVGKVRAKIPEPADGQGRDVRAAARGARTGRPAHPRRAWARRPLRGRRGRQRRLVRRDAGSDHRSHRTQRCRQDVGHRRHHRLHPDSDRIGPPRRPGAGRPERHQAGAGRAQPLVPVAGALRGRHRARQPAGRLRPP